MRALILSAGQGTRLHPLTRSLPKCLLPVEGDRSLLHAQLAALARCGVSEARVVTGFGADRVERFAASDPVPGLAVHTLFNPFYSEADNLVSCWLARSWMADEFLLLNGDTLFEDAALRHLVEAAHAPLTLAIDVKQDYDDDDMKVSVRKGRLRAVGKQLPADTVTGESIGLMLFRRDGARAFVATLEQAIREPDALSRWYLSVVDRMAASLRVEVASIHGTWWGEVDYPHDLAAVREHFSSSRSDRPRSSTATAIAGDVAGFDRA